MKITTPWLLALALAASSSVPFRGIAQDPDPGTPTTLTESVTVTEPITAEIADTNAAPVGNDATAQEGGIRLKRSHDSQSASDQPIVVIGNSYTLKAGETAQKVVVIGGSATIHGKVREEVVAVGGSITVDGEISGDAVAVGGSIKVKGEIGGDAVAVLGGLTASEGAKIKGDAVAVGGSVDLADGATLGGSRQGINLPQWLKLWVTQCVLKLRPLAPQVPWLWAVVGVCFLFYLLIAAVFTRPVQACVEELTRRPATTFLMGLLTKLLLPLVLLILAVTGVGVFVIPFVLAALCLGLLVGKVALFEALGQAVGKTVNSAALQRPVLGFGAGFVLVVLLYMIPVIGLLTLMLISLWGLGAAVLAAFSGLRRETGKPPSSPAIGFPPTTLAPVQVPASETAGAGLGQTQSNTAAFAIPPAATPPTLGVSAQPPITAPLDSIAYPRAGFWERMGAAFLDVVLVSMVGCWVHGRHLAFLVALAYFAGMWAWKGTTVGGVVLGLKVVRLDG